MREESPQIAAGGADGLRRCGAKKEGRGPQAAAPAWSRAGVARVERLAALAGADRPPGVDVDRVADDPDAAVAHRRVPPAGVEAAGADEPGPRGGGRGRTRRVVLRGR